MGKIGVMVCGHGSRDLNAVAQFDRLVRHLADRLPHYPVESGFLEFAQPVLREGLDRLRDQGVDRVLAVPGMLFAAGHVKNDVPSVLNQYAADHGITIEFGRELGIDPKLLRAARDRIETCLAAADDEVPREETLLMVIGRGTSDSDANGNVAKVARMLWEGTGFGWAEVGYSGVAHPRVDAALERACQLGLKKIVVFPYFLFTGVLVERIYRQTDGVASRHSDVTFL
ncbi:MAG: sirohydrochlorin chelatase, partial [Pseudomonadota bacterium]